MIEIKKVFISGPMTGLPDLNKPAFDEAEEKLRAAGFSVFNPCWLHFDKGWNDGEIAAVDLVALQKCNYIYQLDGWQKSKGASAEWLVAQWSGIQAVNAEWLEWYVGKGKKGIEGVDGVRCEAMKALARKAREEMMEVRNVQKA